MEENVPDPSPLTANRKEIEIILEQVREIVFLSNHSRVMIRSGFRFSNTFRGITRTFTTGKICHEKCAIQNGI